MKRDKSWGDSFGLFRIRSVLGDWFLVLRCKAWMLSLICRVCCFLGHFFFRLAYHGFVISLKPTNWTVRIMNSECFERKWQEWCTIAMSQVFGKVASWAGRQVGSSAIHWHPWHHLWLGKSYVSGGLVVAWTQVFSQHGWGTSPESEGASAFSLFVLCMISQL